MTETGLFFYFGAFLIPIGYFVNGKAKVARKGMLVSVALQTFWSFAVLGFVWYNWHAGYTDYYYGYALLIPVNVIGAISYFGWLVWKCKGYSRDQKKEPV